MAPQTLNVLLTSFPGLTRHSTLCLPMPVDATLDDLISYLALTTPLSSPLLHRLHYTTNTNKSLSVLSTEPLASYLSSPASDSDILPLRLSAPVLGGKDIGADTVAAGLSAQSIGQEMADTSEQVYGPPSPDGAAPPSETDSDASWGNLGPLSPPAEAAAGAGDAAAADDAGAGGDDAGAGGDDADAGGDDS